MYKIIGADGRQYGPVSADQIKQWILAGRANGQTLAQAEGTIEWKPLSSFPEFVLSIPLNAPPPLQSSVANRASNKIAAGICGILLGSLGVHKFILGYTGTGVLMLVVTVASCGLGALPMYVIGFAEGIIYLTKSDEEFVRTYVDNRREWF